MVDVLMKHDLAADNTLETLLAYSETLAENGLNDKESEEMTSLPLCLNCHCIDWEMGRQSEVFISI